MFKLRANNEKLFILFFLFLILNIANSNDVQAQKKGKIKTVVIDAGHGGKDPGAVGKKSMEKNITLSVAKKTGDYIKQNCPDVNVIYTRSGDTFVSLLRRAQIANEKDADLFISIHCNANDSPQPCGVETFVMGDHRNAANLEVAKLENASILYEDNAEENYGNFNPNSPEAYIMLNFFQSEYKNASLDFAEHIQNQLVKRVGRKDRGVQQAGFLVLYKTAMPSVLVEIGFISNPSEENFLCSEDGQTYIASALFRAFRDYKDAFEKEHSDTDSDSDTKLIDSSTNRLIDSNTKLIDSSTNRLIDTSTNKLIDSSTNRLIDSDKDKVIYKVQIESRSRKVDAPAQHYKGLNNVDYYEHNGQYKYTAGKFYTKSEADEYCKKVKTSGYPSAFVVSFKNGKRL